MDHARPQPREYPLNAPASDQRRLLDVQGVDTRLDQIEHRAKNLPEHSELAQLAERQSIVADEVVVAETLESDIRRELVKAEADVAQVCTRAKRDQARLDAGLGPLKELTALQSELESLARRQVVLEDIEIEIMERLETASAAATAVQAKRDELLTEVTAVMGRRDIALAELAAEKATLAVTRADLINPLDPDLLGLYEKIRGHCGGVGAALLRSRRCEGCRLELNPQELQTIRAACADEVVRCEDCRRILIRTEESGL